MGLGERRKGPSIKYVTLFLANFDPLLPLSHFAILPWTPPKKCVTHLGLPRLLVGLVQENPDKSPLYKLSLNCSRGFLFGGFVRGSFVWKVLSGVVFIRSPFCQKTSVTTEN